MADELLKIIQVFAPDLELKYNKFYIGLAKGDQPNNFAIFRPRKDGLRLEVRHTLSDEIENQLEQLGLTVMDYDKRWRRYRIKLSKADIEKRGEFLNTFLRKAYEGGGS